MFLKKQLVYDLQNVYDWHPITQGLKRDAQKTAVTRWPNPSIMFMGAFKRMNQLYYMYSNILTFICYVLLCPSSEHHPFVPPSNFLISSISIHSSTHPSLWHTHPSHPSVHPRMRRLNIHWRNEEAAREKVNRNTICARRASTCARVSPGMRRHGWSLNRSERKDNFLRGLLAKVESF